MSSALPVFNPNAGRLGTLLESLRNRLGPASTPGADNAAWTRRLSEMSPLPMSMDEAEARGWSELDIVFVTGDAYIDHPSFAMAILGRVLEAAGFRIGIVSQPDWRKVDDWRRF